MRQLDCICLFCFLQNAFSCLLQGKDGEKGQPGTRGPPGIEVSALTVSLLPFSTPFKVGSVAIEAHNDFYSISRYSSSLVLFLQGERGAPGEPGHFGALGYRVCHS